MQRKWLYLIVLVCSAAGIAWLAWHRLHIEGQTELDVCFFRNITGLPCPSCGGTRSVIAISKLAFGAAFFINPIGFIITFGIIVFPVWVIYDLVSRKSSFVWFYEKAESAIRNKWMAVLLTGLVAVNWLWNIYKFT